jgi:membrane-associated protein
MHWIYDTVREVLSSWGYWALLLGIFGESVGFPLPGETLLMFASFLSHKESGLRIQFVIPIGIVAAVMGDNLGYWIGRHFGKTFIHWAKKLLHVDDEDVRTARHLIATHGGRTIFFSRFIFGLRTIAGPMAGSLDMDWKRFFKFNLLGAAIRVQQFLKLRRVRQIFQAAPIALPRCRIRQCFQWNQVASLFCLHRWHVEQLVKL